ncbi:hypothetical protein [Haloarchaeobius sp. HME9146]|uniref:hypothetical protein n=1 Tax=Haloarchaeobius sp. HME9146 TaxID=2978732 RepID=UPI0021BF3F1A|nr:hypothetical protein [Haloarchaeobius sp. HME9146]MCT9095266.1 hypothetical protein [Haloarchaeobius sp. HME9146]
MPVRLDFEGERDGATTSWERADPEAALIERFSHFGYRVCLPGGSHHMIAIACDGDEYVGRCDCRGFEYQTGPCAHLCTIRKAEFIDAETIDDEPVTVEPVTEETVRLEPDDRAERARADGGVRRW